MICSVTDLGLTGVPISARRGGGKVGEIVPMPTHRQHATPHASPWINPFAGTPIRPVHSEVRVRLVWFSISGLSSDNELKRTAQGARCGVQGVGCRAAHLNPKPDTLVYCCSPEMLRPHACDTGGRLLAMLPSNSCGAARELPPDMFARTSNACAHARHARAHA